jgi:lipopolysaccharide/colanic/teichoic acid biosynthesis glycosyltransferase
VSSAAPAAVASDRARADLPTIWGCTPQQAHDRFWAAFGVQVVRRHERSEIVDGAELFLLCEPGTLVLFRLSQVLDTLFWRKPRLLLLRVRDARRRAYRETAVAQDGRLVRFERIYRDARARSVRVALTPDPGVAKLWQNAPDVASPWRWLRARIGRTATSVRPATARVYEESEDAQLMECVRDMMTYWRRPDTTVRRARRIRGEALGDTTAHVDDRVLFFGPVWVGAGRRIESDTHVVGPAVLWDDPASRPVPEEVRWLEIEPSSLATGNVRRAAGRGSVPGKRLFDVAFALFGLAVTLPLYPFVALAIFLEDRGPVFFAHRRETMNGREFPCLKFRSMRMDAGERKTRLETSNQADGPQFYIKDDPRTTRVGRVLRKLQIDELPQFLNVLAGHMSIVGPRPSPYSENQISPQWREARLSVRPGITGLWQVMRTRRRGLDFQEWIRYDIEYVENASWLLDLKILGRTVGVLVPGRS